jgi:membrane-associated phospholipid phosphatase
LSNADQWAYAGFVQLQLHAGVGPVTDFFRDLCDPDPYLPLAVAVVAAALLRRRLRLAVAIATILVGANVTTQVLKPLLARPHASELLGSLTLPPGSWPSGHSTAAMALALAMVLAAPARLRPVVAACGSVLAIAVGYSLMVLGSHYPSDVLGGFLMAATWALLAVAALIIAEQRWPSTRAPVPRVSMRAALGPLGGLLIASVVVVALIGLGQPHDGLGYAHSHGWVVAAASAIAALGLSLSTAVMLAVRR